MASTAEELLAAGSDALQSGDWRAARDAFHAALGAGETAEGLNGLGEALWWLGETQASVEYRERAYAVFRRRRDAAQAADVAMGLCVHYRANVGNRAASAGWLARARRLVDEAGLDELRGWVALLEAGETSDPVAGERLARDTRELAARSSDLDLELCALAQIGSCLIDQGRTGEGVALLDEAMAGSLGGEGSSFDTVVFTSCNMIGSCTRCAEFERAVQWIRAADRFTERYGCPFLYVYCRTLYGSVLLATGDWSRADEELGTALREARGSQAPLSAFATATLSELRLVQGRIDEAERLIDGLEAHAPRIVASIQLARGDALGAAETATRGLAGAASNRLEQAALTELLGEAEIARGQHEAAAERGRQLDDFGAALDCQLIRARGERLQGRALGLGAALEAKAHLEAALGAFARLGMPLEAARTRRSLGETILEWDPELAVAEVRAALDSFEELGAERDADAAASLLRERGVKAARRSAPGQSGALTKRELEVLSLLGEGLSNPEIAERLYLSRKTVEHHVASVLRKLGLRNRAEAAAEAVRTRQNPPRNR